MKFFVKIYEKNVCICNCLGIWLCFINIDIVIIIVLVIEIMKIGMSILESLIIGIEVLFIGIDFSIS